MIQQNVDIPCSDGQRIAGLLRVPENTPGFEDGKAYPSLVLLPDLGQAEDAGLIVDLADRLSQENFVTLRLEVHLPHHKPEQKKESVLHQQIQNIKAAITFLETVHQADKANIGLVGHGIGGNACILLGDLRVKAIATVGVPVNLDMPSCNNVSSCNMIDAVESCAVPLLLFHGTADASSPFEDARRLYQHAPNPTLEIIEEADHHFTHPQHRQYLIESIRNFFIRSFQRKRFER